MSLPLRRGRLGGSDTDFQIFTKVRYFKPTSDYPTLALPFAGEGTVFSSPSFKKGKID